MAQLSLPAAAPQARRVSPPNPSARTAPWPGTGLWRWGPLAFALAPGRWLRLARSPRIARRAKRTWSLAEDIWAWAVGAPNGNCTLSRADYRRYVEDAQGQMRRALSEVKAGPLTLDQAGNAASLYGIGRVEYQRRHGRLNLSNFCGIMEFDAAAGVITVGCKTDFKILSRFLLPLGFTAQIVPEVDTVTVGGAISGVVMESSSFRYGFVHNGVLNMDVLLPDGSVVTCSREQQPELFKAMPHSYGTLGYVLSASLKVVPAEQEVVVTAREFSRAEDAVDHMSESMADQSVDFVEGIMFNQERTLSISASMRPSAEIEVTHTVVLPDDGRFVDILSQLHGESCFRMTTFDYLYRWDCDIFWSTRRTATLGDPAAPRQPICSEQSLDLIQHQQE